MQLEEIKKKLKDIKYIEQNSFQLIKKICNIYNSEPNNPEIQEIILRALDKKEHFGTNKIILNSLVREIGLFPYLELENSSVKDLCAFYAHVSPLSSDENPIVFHKEQAKVFYKLMSGSSVVLSAPTSFGKSFIIDAIISTQKFNNIVLIVPTIALIDETRRRLSKFKNIYNIITHGFQEKSKKNIYILTQERCLENSVIDQVDFFIIDEFYKLSQWADDSTRCALLNQAFYGLYKKCKHFYMLGPNISGISKEFKDNLEFEFIRLNYNTVVNEFHYNFSQDNNYDKLKLVLDEINDQTIIFCKSPKSANDVAKYLINQLSEIDSKLIKEFSDWIGKNYHEEWTLIKSLLHGIGIHHGRIPRAIAHFITRLFNAKKIKFLICTSTLIEGVNTNAKNIIIFDNYISNHEIDFFTFNNIAGRSGRMFKHFIGNVYLLQPPPDPQLPFVDIPAFSQDENINSSLLINIDEKDLKDDSIDRIRPILDNKFVSLKTIKSNVGVDPEDQINFANDLHINHLKWHQMFVWKNNLPTWNQLIFFSELIWTYFNGARLGNRSVASAKQLAYFIQLLSKKTLIKQMIIDKYKQGKVGIDEAVNQSLDFKKLWANFHFPKLLRTINSIQKEVYLHYKLKTSDFIFYSNQVENYFTNSSIIALEEYGLPIEISLEIKNIIDFNNKFEDIILDFKKLDLEQTNFSYIEKIIFKSFKSGL